VEGSSSRGFLGLGSAVSIVAGEPLVVLSSEAVTCIILS
jgi:hypothetical protein